MRRPGDAAPGGAAVAPGGRGRTPPMGSGDGAGVASVTGRGRAVSGERESGVMGSQGRARGVSPGQERVVGSMVGGPAAGM